MAEHLPCIPEPAGWVRHLQREHAEVAYPVPHCRKDRQNWPCDTIKALEMAAAAERERLLNGPVARIEPDPDQPGYNRGVFDVDAAIAQAVAAERERIAALADECHATYTHARGPNVPGFRRAFSALVRTTTGGNPS